MLDLYLMCGRVSDRGLYLWGSCDDLRRGCEEIDDVLCDGICVEPKMTPFSPRISLVDDEPWS